MGAAGFGAAAGLSLAGGVWSALAADAAGVYNESMSTYDAQQMRIAAELDAKQLDDQAVDAINRGELDAQRLAIDTRQLIGERRVGYAANGVDVSTGSAADVQMDSRELSARDMRQIRLNAAEEAKGIRTTAARTRMSGVVGANRLQAEGRAGRRSARSQAVGSVLTGGAQALSLAAQGVESYQNRNP